ncbi:MAG: hypothetical protein H0W74_10045 [Sphingosinicella sp.]|nr:hypothetical protein [Sphingosinicella sp.]
MSHIPNSAMPHAGPDLDKEDEATDRNSLYERAGRAAEKARENPRTSIAAGAAMIVGAIAAAAIPFIRSRNKTETKNAPARKQPGTKKQPVTAKRAGSGPAANKSAASPKASARKSASTSGSKKPDTGTGIGTGRAKKSGTGTSKARAKK